MAAPVAVEERNLQLSDKYDFHELEYSQKSMLTSMYEEIIMITVKIKKLREDAIIPSCSYQGDAGYDLFAIDSYVLNPGERYLVRTGIAIELPPYTEAQIRPRSGYALKNGITVLNSPGTIDQGYRNELGVILINLGQEPFFIEKGNRIAQLVIKPVYEISFIEMDQLEETQRGLKGFGSSTES